ncbi:MAG TPA: methionyl-tRNA formyltransferase, partial [Candidatus Limnocylindrales bacterium]
MRTVFLGSGGFGVEALWRLDGHEDVDLVGVVTAPPRPAGRKQRLTSTVIDGHASELAVPTILRPERLRAPDAVAAVLALRPQLLVLADYGQIVPSALLDVEHGALNLHPSLLPRHRGATPIPATILAGDTETGVTLIRMDDGLDTGPIVGQERVALGGTETAPRLEEELMIVADQLLDRTLGPWLRGELEPRPQPEDGATLTRPLRREDGRLDPARSAAELERAVRAYQPWPGTFLDTPLGRLIVHRAALATGVAGDEPGRIHAHGGGLAIGTPGGRLVLERLQLAGGRVMDGEDLRRGFPQLVGADVLAQE